MYIYLILLRDDIEQHKILNCELHRNTTLNAYKVILMLINSKIKWADNANDNVTKHQKTWHENLHSFHILFYLNCL